MYIATGKLWITENRHDVHSYKSRVLSSLYLQVKTQSKDQSVTGWWQLLHCCISHKTVNLMKASLANFDIYSHEPEISDTCPFVSALHLQCSVVEACKFGN